MKAVLTLVLVLITGVAALANTGKPLKEFNLNIESHVEVTSLKMDTVLDSGIIVATNGVEDAIANEKSVARLYKYKNSRVKKALAFSTKNNKAKMA